MLGSVATLARRSRGRVSANPHRWTALLLGALLLATAAATAYTSDVQREDRERRISRDATVTVAAIERRLDAYGDVLVALRGLFEIEPNPSRDTFGHYVRSLRIGSRHPGIRAVSYARVARGHAILTRIEPRTPNARALGFDVLSDPARRGAFAASRASGRPAATSPVRLPQRPHGRPGLVLLLAIAGAADRPATGVVTAQFNPDVLIHAIVGSRADFDLEVYDVGSAGAVHTARPSPSNVVYGGADRLRAPQRADGPQSVLRRLDVAGRRWLVYYTPHGATVAVGPNQWIVAIGGAIGSLLAGWLFLTLARGRSVALARAGRMTRELEASERQMREVLEGALQAQRKFEQFVEFAPDAIVGVREDGTIVLVNAQVERVFGYTRAELVDQSIEMLIPERLRSVHAAHREGFFEDPGTRSMGADLTLFARRKDGSEFPAEIRLSNIETADGPLATAAVRDVTERRRMQSELATKEGQTRQILETAHDAFISIDERGVITDWNRQAEATFGWSREEAVGRLLGDTIVPAAHRTAHERGIKRFLQTHEPHVLGRLIELPAVHRDGHEFPVELTISPLRTPDGYRFNAFVRDITQRTRTQEQLALAHAQAIEASRMKSDFVANMSHEIRTPLNGVIGLSGLLLGTELDDEQRDYADSIRASGDALMAVISDILDFSKIEAGKLEIEEHPFELHEVVDGVSAMLAMEAHEKGLDLMVWVDDDVPSAVGGDAARIRQVLANLATNAIKFTHAGEVVMRVTLEPGAGGPTTVRFAVSDTGIGIEPAAAGRIFDAFSQADTSTTREYGGTGLGLAISKQLVELMGGRIGLESAPGTGSTFWFTVPVTAGRREPASPAAVRANFAELRVLVVDDSATSRTILEHQLTSWGMTCDTAGNSDEALGMLRAAASEGRSYRLALLDFQMPQASGLDLARAVQAAPELSAVRLMMLSTSGAEREAAAQAGVQGFVTKPVRASRLGQEIARVLGAGQLVPMTDAVRVPMGLREQSRMPGGRPVLVAEDASVNQLVAVRLLEKIGFRADIAANGREAVEMNASGHYEAIFMDCQMPELDGYQATAEIRRRESGGSHVPIIAMTAHTLRGDRERCLAAGMDDYIGKPIRTADLAEVIARALSGERSRGIAGEDLGDDQQAPLMDASRLDEVFGDDRQSRASLVGQFVEQSRTTITELGLTIAAGDSDAVARLAHGLKGSAAVVGAERLAAIASQLSERGAAGRLSDAETLRAELVLTFESTSRALESSGLAQAIE